MPEIPITLPGPEGQNPPCVRFDLDKAQSKVLADMRPGTFVRIVVTGKLTDLSLYKYDDDKKTGFIGHCSVEASRMSVSKAEDSMESLMEEDD